MWCPKSGKLGKESVHFMGYSLESEEKTEAKESSAEENNTEE